MQTCSINYIFILYIFIYCLSCVTFLFLIVLFVLFLIIVIIFVMVKFGVKISSVNEVAKQSELVEIKAEFSRNDLCYCGYLQYLQFLCVPWVENNLECGQHIHHFLSQMQACKAAALIIYSFCIYLCTVNDMLPLSFSIYCS